MRWHVMIGTKTFGPMESEAIREMLRTRKLGAGAFVRDESAGDWLPIERSPFQAMVQKRRLSAGDVALRVVAWVVGVYAVVWLSWVWIKTH